MRVIAGLAAVSVFALLCWDASVRLAEAYPTLSMCIKDPVKHTGKPVWIAPTRVLESEPDGFEVVNRGHRIRVHSTMRPPLGVHVMVYGTFQADRTVRAIASAEERGFPIKRLGVLVVSLVVLVAGVFGFRRAFVWRDGAFHPR